MKILYGVQATGNGHISRARAMAPLLKARGIEVQYLFSGREKEKLFNMEPFGDYLWRPGFTLYSKQGKINLPETVFKNNLLKLGIEISALDISQYDFIVTDFEPITAWAGKIEKKPVIGIGHQYAFNHDVPRTKGAFAVDWVWERFAPVNIAVGLHWHHYNAPILPPIAPAKKQLTATPNKVLVYLPFEPLSDITKMLRQFKHIDFQVYHPDAKGEYDIGHISWHLPCKNGFRNDFESCEGVICNAGFMLATEALQMGKRLLVKAMDGQSEQLSNVISLKQLGLARSMKRLNSEKVAKFLACSKPAPIINYPDTASALADWIAQGATSDPALLAKQLWQQATVPYPTDFKDKQPDEEIATF